MPSGEKNPINGRLPSTLRLLTWNVDFLTENASERLGAALGHIQRDVFRCRAGEGPEPCCILLQEVHIEAFHVILDNEWVRQHFAIAPVSPDKWPPHAEYGNVTLVSRTIPISEVWSLEFESSAMSRNALLVDLKLSESDSDSRVVTLRVANTHLESLSLGEKVRPVQMGLIAKLLKEKGIDGGIVGGDMNAIGASDAGIARSVGLVDSWKGREEDEEGYTWGYQTSEEYPPGRLDKILFTPGRRIEVEEPKMIGVGVTTVDDIWVSDHYGLITTVRML